MTLYFEYPCIPLVKSDTAVIKWHPNYPQLAVGTIDGSVHIYLDEVRTDLLVFVDHLNFATG
jgi:hypothetical protein